MLEPPRTERPPSLLTSAKMADVDRPVSMAHAYATAGHQMQRCSELASPKPHNGQGRKAGGGDVPLDPAGARGFLREIVRMLQSRGDVAPDAPEEPGPGRDPIVEIHTASTTMTLNSLAWGRRQWRSL